jgi:hypothetical protein
MLAWWGLLATNRKQARISVSAGFAAALANVKFANRPPPIPIPPQHEPPRLNPADSSHTTHQTCLQAKAPFEATLA